jgi:hypothetical protein
MDLLATVWRHSYIGAALLVLYGCPGPRGRLVPVGSFQTATVPEFAAAFRGTAPTRHEIVRFRWRAEDDRLSLAGAGAARIAPPDSLRVDLAASLGVGRSTIVLAGESVQAQPEEVVEFIVPDRRALWLAMGVVRETDTRTVEVIRDGERRWWRTTDSRGRTTIYAQSGETLTGVRREVNGRLMQELRLQRDADGRVRRAQLEDHVRGARLVLDVTGRETSEPFGPETWRLAP